MITLYTINCPKCLILEKKLYNKGIVFNKISDIDKLIELGFENATFPLLKIEDELYEYSSAINWINNYKEN